MRSRGGVGGAFGVAAAVGRVVVRVVAGVEAGRVVVVADMGFVVVGSNLLLVVGRRRSSFFACRRMDMVLGFGIAVGSSVAVVAARRRSSRSVARCQSNNSPSHRSVPVQRAQMRPQAGWDTYYSAAVVLHTD